MLILSYTAKMIDIETYEWKDLRTIEDITDPGKGPRKKKDIGHIVNDIGMISHKKSLITIFGHKHKIKNFILKLDIFHEKKKKKKISTAQQHLNFSPYLE